MLGVFFFLGERAPWVLCLVRPLAVAGAVLIARGPCRAISANQHAILGLAPGRWERVKFAMAVFRSFYDFVIDVARLGREEASTLRDRVDEIEGREAYLACREGGRGAVLVTAHMGSFEVGLAALTTVERGVHVVFKRDEFPAFERLRAGLRARLGVREAAIDDGWSSLLQLRDALSANEVIVMQTDRAFAGQRSALVAAPPLSRPLRVPVGPVTMARLGGCPVVPVFVVRSEKRGRFRVILLDPIEVGPGAAGEAAALAHIGAALGRFVAAYPDQWLVLHRAFAETEAS
jgi:KDO2-lipid IV(A) lauroyltransferase